MKLQEEMKQCIIETFEEVRDELEETIKDMQNDDFNRDYMENLLEERESLYNHRMSDHLDGEMRKAIVYAIFSKGYGVDSPVVPYLKIKMMEAIANDRTLERTLFDSYAKAILEKILEGYEKD